MTVKKIDRMAAGSGRRLKENDDPVNIADLIEELHAALVTNKDAGVQLMGSLPKETLQEQLTEDDAVTGTLTFSEEIYIIEIYNTDTANAGTFTVNGISILVPAGESFMAAVGGTPATTIAVTGSTSYIINRYTQEVA